MLNPGGTISSAKRFIGRKLGEVDDEIRSASFQVTRGEVAFEIDANAILDVSARDRDTGKEQRVTISGSASFFRHEVERMIRDAEAHSAEEKARCEHLVQRAREALRDASGGDRLLSIASDLEQALHMPVSVGHRGGQGASGRAAGATPSPPYGEGSDVVDAEYVAC